MPSTAFDSSTRASPGAVHLVDSHGLPVSTDRPDSLAAYEAALDLLHSGRSAKAAIAQVLDTDSNFVMGHAFRAALPVMAADEAVRTELAQTLRIADALRDRANDRERRHFAAARAWFNRDLLQAIRLYGEILDHYPRDSLALRVAHFGDFQLDQTALLCDRVAQVLPHWNENLPHYGYVLGMHAFGLEESGRYSQAEETGRRALTLNPRNPGAIHAVAHVLGNAGPPARRYRLARKHYAAVDRRHGIRGAFVVAPCAVSPRP